MGTIVVKKFGSPNSFGLEPNLHSLQKIDLLQREGFFRAA
jgi:hypothetical protein